MDLKTPGWLRFFTQQITDLVREACADVAADEPEYADEIEDVRREIEAMLLTRFGL